MPWQPVDQIRGARRFDYLLDALDYGEELTPAENRRRINALRAGHTDGRSGRVSLPGRAPNAGVSQRMPSEQRNALKQGIASRPR